MHPAPREPAAGPGLLGCAMAGRQSYAGAVFSFIQTVHGLAEHRTLLGGEGILLDHPALRMM